MLHIDTLTLGAYQVNCYIVRREDSDRCVVIDPGYEPGRILTYLQKNNLQLEAILLTHGHFDHVGGVRELAADTDCQVYMRPEEELLPPQITAGQLFYTNRYPEGGQLQIAGMDFLVLHTPGHTPGSVCLLTGDVIFSGDTLFAGSCGRTDFPGGNMADMLTSLQHLRDLPANYRVFPGHAEATSLEAERRSNPYMQ